MLPGQSLNGKNGQKWVMPVISPYLTIERGGHLSSITRRAPGVVRAEGGLSTERTTI